MKMTRIFQTLPSDLCDYFYYDITSPSFLRWRTTIYTGCPKRVLVSKGDVAGGVVRGYYKVRLRGKTYRINRVIWSLFNNQLSNSKLIDHIDGNPTNNNIENLREVSHKENSRNCKRRKDNSTGVTGVAKTKRISQNKIYWYYTALWKTEEGLQRTANFSTEELGDDVAFLFAICKRQQEIEALIENGASYTSRHGTH